MGKKDDSKSTAPTRPDVWLGRDLFMKIRKATLDEMLRRAVEQSIPEGTEKIAVWASGGIDSSALLWYLKDQGWDAEGIHVYFEEGARSLDLFNGVTEHLGLAGLSYKMELKDHFQLLPYALVNHEGTMSAFPTLLLFMALRSMKYDLILHGLGLDELVGGYRQHAEALDRDFVAVENRFYAELPMRQRNTEIQPRSLGLSIAAPFISDELRAWGQSLPRTDKTLGNCTKIILRKSMRDRIPESNRMDGFFAGSKEGFHPPIKKWWLGGLGYWTMSRLSRIDKIRLRKRSLWAKIIRANERERKRVQSMVEKANGN